MWRCHPALLALAALALGGCGGGNGRGGPVTVSLPASSTLSGSVASTGYVTVGYLGVGDRSPPSSPTISFRAFVSFDLSAIPAGATVRTATLTLHQTRVFGTPYARLGPLVVDQVVYGNVLDAGAYSRSFPSSQGFAALSTDATVGPRSVLATAQVEDNLASGRTLSQFRIRFTAETDGNMTTNEADLGSTSGAASTTSPTLVVTYE
jgi:hypothetical protein